MARNRDARVLCEKLLKLQHKIADDLLQIDDCKEALRGICEENGEGFTEEVEGLGSVEVKAGQEAKLKGILPVLKAEIFLGLTERRRDTLISEGIVAMEEQRSRATKPSVTVRL